jgi:hypothetical protein
MKTAVPLLIVMFSALCQAQYFPSFQQLLSTMPERNNSCSDPKSLTGANRLRKEQGRGELTGDCLHDHGLASSDCLDSHLSETTRREYCEYKFALAKRYNANTRQWRREMARWATSYGVVSPPLLPLPELPENAAEEAAAEQVMSLMMATPATGPQFVAPAPATSSGQVNQYACKACMDAKELGCRQKDQRYNGAVTGTYWAMQCAKSCWEQCGY